MLKRAFFAALAIQCVTTMATPAAAQSPTVRDLVDRVTILEGKVSTLENQVVALQSGAAGSKTHAAPFQLVGSQATLLDVPGKILVAGVCALVGDSQSPRPMLLVTAGNRDAPVWYNEVGSVGGFLAQRFGQGLVRITPNLFDSVILAQGHIALVSSSEVVTFSAGGVVAGDVCGFSVQATVTPAN